MPFPEIKRAGFHADVVESVNVPENVKLDGPTGMSISKNYIETLKKPGQTRGRSGLL